MKGRGWLVIVVGGILATIGAYVVINSFISQNTSATSIPAGAFYVYFEINVLGPGSLHVEYAVSNGTVDVFALTEAQYALYANTSSSEALHAERESAAGSFDVALPGSGRYFVAFNHGDAYEGVAQVVQTTLRLHGIDLPWFLTGLVVLGVGTVVIVYGVVRRRKAMRVRVPAEAPVPPILPLGDAASPQDRRPPEPPMPPPPPESPRL